MYDQLAQPVWMSHGVRGNFTDYRGCSFVTAKPNWQLTVYPTDALPHFEVPIAFFADFDAFLAGDFAQFSSNSVAGALEVVG